MPLETGRGGYLVRIANPRLGLLGRGASDDAHNVRKNGVFRLFHRTDKLIAPMPRSKAEGVEKRLVPDDARCIKSIDDLSGK